MKNTLTTKLFPTVTNMVRLDHTHVLLTFHQYHVDSSPMVKEGLVKTACTALEIHAQLEEEIFYPAVRAVTQDEALKKSVPEHDEMRRLIAKLRSMKPTDPGYDDTFMELMRDVIHHVADEETIVLPEAERLLADELESLGAAMTKRRLMLVAPRTGEIVVNMAKAMPSTTIGLAAAVLAGACAATWYSTRKGSRFI
jgi:hemerythrin superfamily protein